MEKKTHEVEKLQELLSSRDKEATVLAKEKEFMEEKNANLETEVVEIT